MPFITEERAAEVLELGKSTGTSLVTLKPCRDPGVATVANKYSTLDKILMGTLGHIDGEKATSKALGVNRMTISAAMEGRRSTESGVDPDLKEKVASSVMKFRQRLQSLTSTKLEMVLDNITPEKIEAIGKVTELASVASMLSKVHKDFDVVDNQGQQTNIQFQIFRPRTRNEDEYDVVEVLE